MGDKPRESIMPNSDSSELRDDISDELFVEIRTSGGAQTGEKEILSPGEGNERLIRRISSETLASNMADLCRYVGKVFDDASTASRYLELESLEVQLEITASGEVRLVGAISTEVKGGLTLTFKKRENLAQ